MCKGTPVALMGRTSSLYHGYIQPFKPPPEASSDHLIFFLGGGGGIPGRSSVPKHTLAPVPSHTKYNSHLATCAHFRVIVTLK